MASALIRRGIIVLVAMGGLKMELTSVPPPQSVRLTLAGSADESTRSRSMIFLLLALALILCEAFLIRR